jgi:hypothetical protein
MASAQYAYLVAEKLLEFVSASGWVASIAAQRCDAAPAGECVGMTGPEYAHLVAVKSLQVFKSANPLSCSAPRASENLPGNEDLDVVRIADSQELAEQVFMGEDGPRAVVQFRVGDAQGSSGVEDGEMLRPEYPYPVGDELC